MCKSPLYVAGAIFGLASLVHLYRLYSHFNVIVGTTEIPLWVNVIGAIVSAGLSYWMFSSACSKCTK